MAPNVKRIAQRLHRPLSVVAVASTGAHVAASGTFHFLDFVASWRVVMEVVGALRDSGGIVPIFVLILLGSVTVAFWVRKDKHDEGREGGK